MARRILLIEDETGIRDSVTDLIQTLGYVVKGCENGRMAMEKLPIFRPNLIISDIMMPEMDGIEFLCRIKSDNNYNDIPIVLLTAKSEFEDRIEGLQYGADNYLTKPFNITELQLVIKNLFELGRYSDGNGLFFRIKGSKSKNWLFRFTINRNTREIQ